jgi:hypothetical protein
MDMSDLGEDFNNAGFVKWEVPESLIVLLTFASIGDGHSWQDDQGVATVAGLILGKFGEDTYERLGCFTTLSVKGAINLSQHPQTTLKLI